MSSPETERKQSQQTPNRLSFTAVSDGLGFHPFSDGLPYAPPTKSQTGTQNRKATVAPPAPVTATPTTGTGAVVAGPPRFVVSPPKPALPQRPAALTPEKARASKQPEVAPAPVIEFAHYGLAYLIKRFLAYVTDTLLNWSLGVAALSLSLLKLGMDPMSLLNPGVAFLAGLFLCVFSWALITAQEVAFGTSVGKRLFGLVVRGTVAATFLRAFFFIPSLGFCGAGLIWALFDRNRRAWHDLVVDLQPEEIASL